MRRELAAATVGLIGGWMLFHPKGQETAKDLCLLALDSAGIGDDKIGKALKDALCEPKQKAIEHVSGNGEPHTEAEVTHDAHAVEHVPAHEHEPAHNHVHAEKVAHEHPTAGMETGREHIEEASHAV